MCPHESPGDRDEDEPTWTGRKVDEEPAATDPDPEPEPEPAPAPEPEPRSASIPPPGAELPPPPPRAKPEGGLLAKLRRRLGR